MRALPGRSPGTRSSVGSKRIAGSLPQRIAVGMELWVSLCEKRLIRSLAELGQGGVGRRESHLESQLQHVWGRRDSLGRARYPPLGEDRLASSQLFRVSLLRLRWRLRRLSIQLQ